RRLVDQRLARGVDEPAAALHRRELRTPHQVLGLGAGAHVKGHEIGLLEQRGEARNLAHARDIGRLHVRVVHDHAPAEGDRPPPPRPRRRPRRATRRPTLPYPPSPSTCPPSSWPRNCAPSYADSPSRPPSSRNFWARGKPRAIITMNASAWSATASAFLPGV